MNKLFIVSVLLTSYLNSCQVEDETSEIIQESTNIVLEIDTTEITPVPVGLSFDWCLEDVSIKDEFSADVVDVDAFETPKEVVQKLKQQGKIVIAYVSVGSVESYRDDADDFPDEVIGKVYDGYEDEKWLDIRKIDLLAPVLTARFDMIKEKGFDGIEPDNMNGYQNKTGFGLTENDALIFCRWLISEAHKRGLSIGQKNGEELVEELADEFDWMLTEDAFADDWYQYLDPYIEAGKAVFVTEYTDMMTEKKFTEDVCPVSKEKKFYAILKDRDLTKEVVTCD